VVFNCARNQASKGGRPTTAAGRARGVLPALRANHGARRLDLRVDEGELYGLIGPNGAGKTTALRVALGLLKADAGQVRLLGRDPRSAAGARPRRVGSLIEAPALSPRLTGREYLVLIARWADAPDSEVDRVAGLLGLGRMTDRPTATYSSGMRQVLATAAALVGPPDLLVLDEPTVGLDPGHRRRVNDLLRTTWPGAGRCCCPATSWTTPSGSAPGRADGGRAARRRGPPTELGPAAGRFEVTVSDPEAALSALRALRLICWRDGDNGKVLVETGAPYQVGRPDAASSPGPWPPPGSSRPTCAAPPPWSWPSRGDQRPGPRTP
jgi:ABC-type Na+ transport system ATPase subunit NatA